MTADEIDSAIVEFLRNEDAASERMLAQSGPAGLERMLDLWFGRTNRPLQEPPDVPRGRAGADAWGGALSVVARANPAAFVDGLAGEHVSTTILAILGDVSDPRATRMLCAHLDDADWLRRYNAVASLSRRSDKPVKACLERALADTNLVVRSQAVQGLSRWDPARAIHLYGDLLRADGLTPLLRAGAESALRDLRAGRPVRDPPGSSQ